MKNKILEVTFGGLGHGGVSSVIFSIVSELKDKYDFGCVVYRTKLERESDFAKIGKLHRLPCYRKNGKKSLFEEMTRPIRFFFGIYNLCKKEKYTVVHAHNEPDEGVVLLAAKFAGVKIRIAHSHNTPSPKKPSLFKRILNSINRSLINRNATHKIGCSKNACESFFKTNTFKVIVNPVDLDKFVFKTKEAKKDDYSFVHIGRYCYQKNQTFLIDVFSIIKKTFIHSSLNLIGFGEDEQLLKDKINTLGLNDCVHLLPGKEIPINEYLANADFMIFPSIYEGFGIVLIEAQASGVFCFCSENIQDEADAGMIKKIDLASGAGCWAECIIQYISQNAGKEYFIGEKLKLYEKTRIISQYELLYEGKQ